MNEKIESFQLLIDIASSKNELPVNLDYVTSNQINNLQKLVNAGTPIPDLGQDFIDFIRSKVISGEIKLGDDVP